MLECFSMTTTRHLPDEGEKDVKERMLRVWVGGAGSLISLEWKMTDDNDNHDHQKKPSSDERFAPRMPF